MVGVVMSMHEGMISRVAFCGSEIGDVIRGIL